MSSLLGTVNTVTCVAKAWKNVSIWAQLTINGAGVEAYLWVKVQSCLDTLRARNNSQATNVLDTCFTQELNSSSERATSCQ